MNKGFFALIPINIDRKIYFKNKNLLFPSINEFSSKLPRLEYDILDLDPATDPQQALSHTAITEIKRATQHNVTL